MLLQIDSDIEGKPEKKEPYPSPNEWPKKIDASYFNSLV